jgi:alkanesulfonate monooxygenase SsuD/methylene tetrahydromethanopterin reductase-like flavin-dependent oxidoreductase (luciferase family)
LENAHVIREVLPADALGFDYAWIADTTSAPDTASCRTSSSMRAAAQL